MAILTLILVVVAIILLGGMLSANPPVGRGRRYALFLLLEIVVGIVTLFTISSGFGQVLWLILAATPYIVEIFVEIVVFRPMRIANARFDRSPEGIALRERQREQQERDAKY